MKTATSDTTIVHPWDLYGFVPPYRLTGVVEIPPTSLAEANPEAYNNALRALPSDVPCGICDICGASLMVNFILVDRCGRKFVVGCDCVKKSGQTRLITQVEKIERERVNARNRARAAAAREAERLAYIAEKEAELARQRAANGGMTDAEKAEAASKAKAAALMAVFGPIVARLADNKGGFRDSVARDLEAGFVPQGRAAVIAAEILAKQVGKPGTEAYTAERDRIAALFEHHRNGGRHA